MTLNQRQYLVLLKGEDKTADVRHIAREGARTAITFKSGKTFRYSTQNVRFLSNPVRMSVEGCRVCIDGETLSQVEAAYRFDKWVKVFLANERTKCGLHSSLVIHQMKHSNEKSTDILAYYRELAKVSPLRTDKGESLLSLKYRHLDRLSNGSILYSYLYPKSLTFKKDLEAPTSWLIYPFGCNLSQQKAIQIAIQNPASLIQGPPGTGKTQTILNVIANLVLQGKKVAVVSSNNSATANVLEKLKKFDLGFLCAFLGSDPNKEAFIQSQDDSRIELKSLGDHEMSFLTQEIPKLNVSTR